MISEIYLLFVLLIVPYYVTSKSTTPRPSPVPYYAQTPSSANAPYYAKAPTSVQPLKPQSSGNAPYYAQSADFAPYITLPNRNITITTMRDVNIQFDCPVNVSVSVRGQRPVEFYELLTAILKFLRNHGNRSLLFTEFNNYFNSAGFKGYPTTSTDVNTLVQIVLAILTKPSMLEAFTVHILSSDQSFIDRTARAPVIRDSVLKSFNLTDLNTILKDLKPMYRDIVELPAFHSILPHLRPNHLFSTIRGYSASDLSEIAKLLMYERDLVNKIPDTYYVSMLNLINYHKRVNITAAALNSFNSDGFVDVLKHSKARSTLKGLCNSDVNSCILQAKRAYNFSNADFLKSRSKSLSDLDELERDVMLLRIASEPNFYAARLNSTSYVHEGTFNLAKWFNRTVVPTDIRVRRDSSLSSSIEIIDPGEN